MAELILHLPHELNVKLTRAATQEAKAPERFVLELIEHSLKGSSFEVVERHSADQARTFGSLKQSFEAAGFASNKSGDALLEAMSEEDLREWYDNPIFPAEAAS